MPRAFFARPATAAQAAGVALPNFSTNSFLGSGFTRPEDRLPARARERYRLITETALDLNLVARNAGQAANDAIQLREQRAREMRKAKDDALRHVGAREEELDAHPTYQRAKAAYDRAAADATRARDIADRKSARAGPIMQIATLLERSIGSVPEGLVDDESAPRLRKGETHADALDRIRRDIGNRLADAQSVRTAPAPSSEAIARMHVQIHALAQRGAPDCFALIERAGDITFPMTKAKITRWAASPDGSRSLPDPTAGHADTPDALAVLAWVARDDLKAALEAEIRAIADDANALTPAERQTRLAGLEAEIAELEREAARVAWAAHDDSGADLDLAGIDDPVIILGIAPTPPTA